PHAAAASAALAGVHVAPGTPGGVRFTVTIPAASVVRADSLQQLDEVRIPGYGAVGGAPGSAALPTRILLVAVPPLGEVRLSAVASETSVRDGVTLPAYPGMRANG